MEALFENMLALSPLLAVPALIQRRWSRPLAILAVAILIGLLTAIVAWMPLRGPGDAAMGRGLIVIYGMAACFVLTIAAGAAFIWSAGRTGAAAGDAGDESESVAMFNRATQGDEAGRRRARE